MTNVDETLLTNMEKVMAGEPAPTNADGTSTEPWPRKTATELKATPVQAQAAPAAPPTKVSAVQNIARDITRLTWREAEMMGRAIQEKAKAGGGEGSLLTQAIQDWAWAWQTFKEEEQPK